MLTRRTLLACSVATAAVLALHPAAWAQAAPEATRFVEEFGSALVSIIDGPGSYDAKKRQLQPVVERSTDVDGIARFCLGRFWITATPQQQTEYLQLFHTVLMTNIFGKLGEFQGVTFAPTTTVQRDRDFLVGTLIKRPNQQPNNVQWDVTYINGEPKIVDVIAEGVSIRQTQRSDYAAYMSRNGNNVDALLKAMQGQIAR